MKFPSITPVEFEMYLMKAGISMASEMEKREQMRMTVKQIFF